MCCCALHEFHSHIKQLVFSLRPSRENFHQPSIYSPVRTSHCSTQPSVKMKTTTYLIAALLPLTFANPQYGNGGSSSTSTSAAAAAATTAAGGSSNVHTVQVGKGGFVFTPDTITAAEGDVVEFMIQPGHSVAQSSFNSPCAPISSAAIFSGTISSATTFSVTVNGSDPLWFYCGTPTHCEGGMAAVINQPYVLPLLCILTGDTDTSSQVWR